MTAYACGKVLSDNGDLRQGLLTFWSVKIGQKIPLVQRVEHIFRLRMSKKNLLIF
jgi:hypothetical protein